MNVVSRSSAARCSYPVIRHVVVTAGKAVSRFGAARGSVLCFQCVSEQLSPPEAAWVDYWWHASSRPDTVDLARLSAASRFITARVSIFGILLTQISPPGEVCTVCSRECHLLFSAPETVCPACTNTISDSAPGQCVRFGREQLSPPGVVWLIRIRAGRPR